MKYLVEYCYTVYDSVEVEADSEEDVDSQVAEMYICGEIGHDPDDEFHIISIEPEEEE